MKAVDIIKPADTRLERFNTWLNWMQTKMLFKHPRSRKVFVYDAPRSERVLGEYYDCEPDEFGECL